MFSIRSTDLPEGALLSKCAREGAFTDCFQTDIARPTTQAEFVQAFYTTWVFKLERSILKWVVSLPSTDLQVSQLAEGSADAFAAWYVESRNSNQLLLSDINRRTRSWLMTESLEGEGDDGKFTRLYFGSAVLPQQRSPGEKSDLGLVFRALMGFHKLYSVVLLHAAKSSLLRTNRASH